VTPLRGGTEQVELAAAAVGFAPDRIEGCPVEGSPDERHRPAAEPQRPGIDKVAAIAGLGHGAQIGVRSQDIEFDMVGRPAPAIGVAVISVGMADLDGQATPDHPQAGHSADGKGLGGTHGNLGLRVAALVEGLARPRGQRTMIHGNPRASDPLQQDLGGRDEFIRAGDDVARHAAGLICVHDGNRLDFDGGFTHDLDHLPRFDVGLVIAPRAGENLPEYQPVAGPVERPLSGHGHRPLAALRKVRGHVGHPPRLAAKHDMKDRLGLLPAKAAGDEYGRWISGNGDGFDINHSAGFAVGDFDGVAWNIKIAR
jgi:hypothetical protein